MPQDEVEKLKQEIQSEYLAAFQKTVAMHETFLQRLAAHPVLRQDENLRVFLEYEQDVGAPWSSLWRDPSLALPRWRGGAYVRDLILPSFSDGMPWQDEEGAGL